MLAYLYPYISLFPQLFRFWINGDCNAVDSKDLGSNVVSINAVRKFSAPKSAPRPSQGLCFLAPRAPRAPCALTNPGVDPHRRAPPASRARRRSRPPVLRPRAAILRPRAEPRRPLPSDERQ